MSQNGAQKTPPISVDFFTLASLVAHHCAKTGAFLNGLAQIFLKLLQYPRDLVGPSMNLKKSAENLTQLIQLINFQQTF